MAHTMVPPSERLHAVLDPTGSNSTWYEVPRNMWPVGVTELEDAMGIGGLNWLCNGAKYMQRTKATEFMYFTKRSFRPLHVSFFDGSGTGHRITIDDQELSVVVKLDPHQRFSKNLSQCKGVELRGDAGAVKRIMVDPRSTVIELFFAYELKAMVHSHGVRVEAVGYELECADPSRADDFEELEERFFHTLRARCVAVTAPTKGALMRHGTFERDEPSPERLDRRAEVGRMLLRGALHGPSAEHDDGFHFDIGHGGWPSPPPSPDAASLPRKASKSSGGIGSGRDPREAGRETEARAEVGRMLFQGFMSPATWDPVESPVPSSRGPDASGGGNPFGQPQAAPGGAGASPFGQSRAAPGGGGANPFGQAGGGASFGGGAGGGGSPGGPGLPVPCSPPASTGSANPFGPRPAGCVGAPWQTVTR